MNAQHEISRRVEIEEEAGSITYSPQWTASQVQRMLGKSPLLDIQILRLMHNRQYRWRLGLGRTHCFDREDLILLFKIMSCEESELHSFMEVKPLSKLCTAMWYLRVVPHRMSGRTPTGVVEREMISDTLNAQETWIAKDGKPHPVAVGNRMEEPIRCWNHQVRDSQETSYRLANIAFVLCWKEVFAEEMKTVVWNWTGPGPATMDPIACLEFPSSEQHECKGLQNMRLYEMKQIRFWFNGFIKNPKTPKRIKAYVQERVNVDPSTSLETIYAWIKSVETGCLGTRSSADRNGVQARTATNITESSQKNSKRNSPQHHRGGPAGKGLRLWKIVDQKASQVPEEDSKFVEKMLSEADTFIQNRQQQLVNEVLKRRAAQVAEWESILEGTNLVDNH